jgi:Rps23 Pro-64 3,4-dihydroxylase Tpa1-like proline 4-hydroxylase
LGNDASVQSANVVEDVFGAWFEDTAPLGPEFRAGRPFPLLVIDEFVRPELAEQLVAEFPSIDDMPKSRDYVFADKHELSNLAPFGPASERLGQALLSDAFASFLSDITGETIFVDPSFHGGGFHQAGDGGFLDMHTDFNIHPLQRQWYRMVNVLLYLNPDWRPEYGGHLLIKARPSDEPRAITPACNRAVIMATNESTYHGFRPMTLPAGVTRRSIAAYGYKEIPEGSAQVRTTGWVPEEPNLAKRVLARNYNTLVQVKNRFFGSGTSKNR